MPTHSRRTVLGALAALALLLLTAPRPGPAVQTLASTAAATDPTGPLVAAVALAAWALALWLVLTAVLVLAARTPGLLGTAAGALVRRLAPSTVRRALEVALGVAVTVAGGAVPAAAATAAATPVPTARAAALATTATAGVAAAGAATVATAGLAAAEVPTAGAAHGSVPSLDWPELRQPAPSPPTPSPTVTPARTAETPPTRAPQPSADPEDAEGPDGSAPDVRAPASPSPVGAAGGAVVVRPGDSLWALAEAHLSRTGTASPTDRQIAAAWPRWWSANREAVGDDPHLLHPGTVLRPPPL